MTPPRSPALPADLCERVLARLGFAHRPEPTMATLRELYSTWCQKIPFDNVRKLIHVRGREDGPLPGTTPDDFFENWLRHGTGGTCWPGAGALQALLRALGFAAERAVCTMLAAPDLPPNHGSVIVTIDDARYLVDSSMLFSEPLRLEAGTATQVAHPAWGVRCAPHDERWSIDWRPLHRPDGFTCRVERAGAEHAEFEHLYERTRAWSPFNYELTVRVNRGDRVLGTAFGHTVTLAEDGTAHTSPLAPDARARLLIEDIGLSEEIVELLPPDLPTPPPPGSHTAATTASSAR